MKKYLRSRIDGYFAPGFWKTTGIDHALEIIIMYAGSVSADPEKIPHSFQTLIEQFESREKDSNQEHS